MNPKITFFAAFILATLTFIFSVSAEKPAAEQPSPFPPATVQPAIDRDAMLRDMAARSAIADLNRTIVQRKRQLYIENPEIAELQEKMRQNQNAIDKILEDDKELKKLKKTHESMMSDMPSFGGAMGPQPMVMPTPAQQAPVEQE